MKLAGCRFFAMGALLLLSGCGEGAIGEDGDDASSLGARGGKKCGNGVCGKGETCSSCPQDCGACPPTSSGSGASSGATSGSSSGSRGGPASSGATSGSGGASSSASSGTGGTGAVGSLVFESGWENTSGLGCTSEALLDGVWNDYGGSTACSGAVHDADIVSGLAFSGSRSLRVTQKPCPSGPGNCGPEYNGTDFRILRTFGDRSEVTLIVRVRYDADYRWASADHKIAIFTDDAETGQNVYLNSRGQPDGLHARILLYSTPADAVFSDAAPAHLLSTGTWYTIRARVVAGDHGRFEAWLTPDGQAEMQLDLTHEAGLPADIDDLPVGAIGGVKLDTTYNLGNAIQEPMYQYYDAVEVYSP